MHPFTSLTLWALAACTTLILPAQTVLPVYSAATFLCLLAQKSTRRVNETLFAPLFRLLPGNWKSIDARDVARAMLAEALAPEQEGVTILTSSQLREKAG